MSESILRADGRFRWHVPGTAIDDSKFVAGTLEIAANGVSTLSLVGLLADDISAEIAFGPETIDSEQCIFGILKDSRYIFLRRISSGGLTFNNVLSHQKYQAREAVVFHDLKELPDLDAVTKLLFPTASGKSHKQPACMCGGKRVHAFARLGQMQIDRSRFKLRMPQRLLKC